MAKKKSNNIILLLSVIIATLAVLMEFGWIIIPGFNAYKFWLLVVAYGLVLAAR